MARRNRVLGAGHDDRHPTELFLSLEQPSAPAGVARYWLDEEEALRTIRTLAAGLQKIAGHRSADQQKAAS